MAASSVMQSILVSPATGVAKPARVVGLKPMTPCCYMPRQQRSSSRLVRCMAKAGQKEKEVETPVTLSQKAEASTDFIDVFAFSGPAPERINSRLAMVGFVAAIAVELSNGQDVFTQISNGGIPWFCANFRCAIHSIFDSSV
ncbi:hypothetical protein Vadar_025047 [Vaccinium darrowii]|uniref:Uncharacterized protein n=1 Tax=Vaccinium darrowii TaxID=229202 RepID=A0ACB7YYZ1_9ERIC|nr:hypothetical protein Vadar_025047 [Vaccinium darrowii]